MNPVRNYKNKNKSPILLSIAIPTWNRAPYLKNLLNNLLPQAKELEEKVEICISNNGSTDNTREVVMKFKEKYPGLIKYCESKKNLGVDINIIRVLEMSNGKFVWTFGDDDNIVENGLNEVVKFLEKPPEENTGLILVRTEACLINKQTGKKIIYFSTLDKNQPEVFKINKKDIIGLSFPNIIFLSALIFNNKIVKKIFREERAMIEKAIGVVGIHIVLHNLMFLKYPYINGIVFNKKIVYTESTPRKPFIEDKFREDYKVPKKLFHLLIFNKYMNDYYAPLLVKRDRGLRLLFIKDMMVLRAFESFNYFSYFGCLRLFFQYAVFIDALLFSLVFSVLFLIPSAVLRFMYKVLLMIRHGKKWKSQWQFIADINSQQFKGARLLPDDVARLAI